MAEDQDKQEEEKIDFTQQDETFGYISRDQAYVLAMRTARESAGAYGGPFVDVPMAFEVVNAEDTEDHYVITLPFRPQGQSSGNLGQEQFFIEKEGNVAHRQVLAVPMRRRLPVLPTDIGLVIVAVVALGGAFASGAFDGGGGPEPTPVPLASPTSTPLPVVIPPTETPFPAATQAAPAPTEASPRPTFTRVPARPTPTSRPAVVARPTATHTPTPTGFSRPVGTLNLAMRQLGPYMGHPGLAGSPQILINSATAVTETLLANNTIDGAMEPMLVESWEISEGFRTWIFKLRRGVPFHRGYGEMTAEDVKWSLEQVAVSERHPRAATVKSVWFNQRDAIRIIDDFTLEINTANSVAYFTMYQLISSPSALSARVTSRRQSLEVGAEVANSSVAATGPWELQSWAAGESGRLTAVRDHWRKTPFSNQMVLWEIQEEATRLAAFLAGQVDAFIAGVNSIDRVRRADGARIMQVPNAGQAGLNIYGLTHTGVGTADQWPNYDPKLPWVSGNSDVRSLEWEQARKVRLAMSIAIDRQLIVDALLKGFGRPLTLRDWGGFEDRLPRDIQWGFDPAQAKKLLAEAGYPDGFAITLTPAIRGAFAEVEACEAVADMWNSIGIKVEFQLMPYAALRTSLVPRTYQGATCTLYLRL